MILRAHALGAAGQARELLELDREWGRRIGMLPFAEASLRVGQRQLSRLRPMSDLPVVRRYLEAIHRGRAHGWHPVVYGLVLATFSIPLRQGLMHYADQTLGGFLGHGDAGDDPKSAPALPPDLTGPLVPALNDRLSGPEAALRILRA